MATIGLKPPDDQRLRATVGTITAAGLVSPHWRMGVPDDADLLILAPDHPDAHAALNRRAAYPRATFVALVGAADQMPADCVKLSWPIRTDEVIRLLKQTESLPHKAFPGGAVAIKDGLLRLATILRRAADERDSALVWRVTGTPRQCLYIAPMGRAFFYEPSIAQLRAMPPDVSLTFETLTSAAIPDGLAPRPLIALQWLAGDLLGALGLLPWIDPKAVLCLTRWPNFPALNHDPRHRLLAALLAERTNGVAALARRARMDDATVSGFVNAASLCGYLGLGDDATPEHAAPRAVPAVRISLLHRLRNVLGIAVK